jgi:hypothetical protein
MPCFAGRRVTAAVNFVWRCPVSQGLGFRVPCFAGRRVTAALARNVAELQRCLSVDAKPFVSSALRSLFDARPAAFHAGVNPLRRLLGDQYRRA